MPKRAWADKLKGQELAGQIRQDLSDLNAAMLRHIA